MTMVEPRYRGRVYCGTRIVTNLDMSPKVHENLSESRTRIKNQLYQFLKCVVHTATSKSSMFSTEKSSTSVESVTTSAERFPGMVTYLSTKLLRVQKQLN